ncbi:MAG: DUF4177 domain-containing protein [Lachnospiraceae bacterium]|nr:DUF4177 domain-containing protein [Lachnospiraceae bacterium]
MKQYEYVRITPKGAFVEKFEFHREIIDDYARRGYKYVGYIPTKIAGYGYITEMDLVFEKDIEEK